jgi:flagellar biosynthesis protein FlhA
VRALYRFLGVNPDIFLVMAMVGVLVILFAPIPAQMLDILLLTNFSLALLILLLTFYVVKPVEFSTFPSVLLMATLFRLSLNVAATRLILSDGDAGRVISAIGAFVVGGNYIIGLIIFLILVVVQYVVVTNGAQRVAEVAARFTLDSMPGQQMSIDADLNMGFINQEEAQQRRQGLQKEASFYGAMDGASKFVKGDAIAGIIILLIDVLGGFAIGVMQHGLSWGEALQIYTLLTIGDGIVTQVPALVISVGTGIIITRSASDSRLSSEVLGQIAAYPKILLMVGVSLLLISGLPGFPVIPAFGLAIVVFFLSWVAHRAAQTQQDKVEGLQKQPHEGNSELYTAMQIDAFEVLLGSELMPLVGTEGELLLERIAAFRKQYALDSGLVLPTVKIKEARRLPTQCYQLFIQGAKVGEGELLPEHWMAIHPGGEKPPLEGVTTTDPAYRLPAVWIIDSHRRQARESGYTVVDPVTVFMTHFSDIVRRYAAQLLSRDEVERLVKQLRETQPGLVEDLLPNIMTLSELQKVLQNLLREKVSIRYLSAIFEVLVDAGRHVKDPGQLTEMVRQRLGNAICQQLVDKEGCLHVVTLDGNIEQTLYESLRNQEQQTTLVLDPRFAEQLLQRLVLQSEKMAGASLMPVMLCAPELRMHLRKLTERLIPHLNVLSMNEVPANIDLKSFNTVAL